MHKFGKWILISSILLCGAPLFGQVDTGAIVGTLRDQSGAVIPSAKVTITEQSTNVPTVAQSNAQGDYVSPPLRSGTYSVKIEAPGFASQTRTGIRLQVQDRLKIDFNLTVGQVSNNVVVTSGSPAINTQGSALGQVISSQVMTELPLDGRDPMQLAALSTGVVMTTVGTNGNTGGGSGSGNDAGNLTSFAADGARGTLNNFLLDGIDNNSNDTGGPLLRTSVDALGEFKIQTNSFSAEFGRSGGAAINAVTRSGTNAYHGDAFEFFRNSALDARGYFEDPTSKKASFKQNQFGGTIGGPILRNRLFWFGDYQGTIYRNPYTYVSSVPTLDQRSGNFSEAGNAVIYDPNTYNPVTDTRTAFSSNTIPTPRIDQLAQRIIDLYPLPNQTGLLKNNFIITPVGQDHVDQGDFRGDYDPSQTNQLFFRWSQSGRTYVTPTPLPGLANGGNSSQGMGSENSMGAALGETHTFTPNTINQFRIGFNWIGINRGIPPGGIVPPPTDLQVPGVALNPKTNGITLFSPSGYRRVGDPGYAPTLLSSEERQITDVVNLLRGNHTIAIGAEMRWSQYNIFQVPAPNGSFSFSGQFTQNPLDSSGGDGLADELLGLPINSTIDTLINVRNRQYVPSAFIQDDYRAKSNLTLNLGLRYDYFSPIVSVNNQQSNFDYATGQLIVAGQNGASRGLVTPDHLNFSPRVGFAWNVKPQTVLSSGFGIFWSGQEIRTAAPLQLAYNLPFYYQPTFVSDGITPVLTVSGGFPPLDPLNAPDPGVTSVDSRLRTPSYAEWNLSFQQGLPFAMTMELSYAGSKGTHLQSLVDQNQVVTPGPGDIQPRRPYPTFGPFAAIENRGNSTYDSLQAKVDKRSSHGLYFLSSFTWSKAINDQPEICCNQPYPQNSWDIPADKGLADFDQRLRWVISADYQLPFLREPGSSEHSHIAAAVFGGWHVGGIYTLATGFPFSPEIGYDPSNTGSQGLLRPNQIENGNLPKGQRNPNLWFNVNAYALPASYTYGDARRNSLVGPGFNNLDASLRKIFATTKSQSVEFRAEFFNLLNHPNFAQPDPFITDGPGAAGVITSTSLANREIQLALKYRF
jgi:hypothetical protein